MSYSNLISYVKLDTSTSIVLPKCIQCLCTTVDSQQTRLGLDVCRGLFVHAQRKVFISWWEGVLAQMQTLRGCFDGGLYQNLEYLESRILVVYSWNCNLDTFDGAHWNGWPHFEICFAHPLRRSALWEILPHLSLVRASGSQRTLFHWRGIWWCRGLHGDHGELRKKSHDPNHTIHTIRSEKQLSLRHWSSCDH